MDFNFEAAKEFIEAFETNVLGRCLLIIVEQAETNRKVPPVAIDPDRTPKQAEEYLSVGWRTIKKRAEQFDIPVTGTGKGQRIKLSGLNQLRSILNGEPFPDQKDMDS